MKANPLPPDLGAFPTTEPQGQGTGLGLAGCLGVVKSHHGHIELRSEPGRTTTVDVYLPCADDDAPHWRETGNVP
ncbi:MAG: ATP-binding protein [bacterium]